MSLNLKGYVTEVSDDCQSSLVVLNEHVEGNTTAIINDKTKGRQDLVHDDSGKLELGQPVVIHDLCGGWGGVFVLHVSK